MNKKVLLAEYDLVTLDSINKLFQKEDLTITVVKDGEKAREVLQNNSFDLMITAAMLPRVHGFNLSRFVAENYPETRVIIISGIYKGVDYKHQAITQYRADNFFEKPLNMRTFKREVFKLLGLTNDDEKPDKNEKPVTTEEIEKSPHSTGTSGGLTSQDLFGDIIKNIESSSPPPSGHPPEKSEVSVPEKIISGKTETFTPSEIRDMIEGKPETPKVKKRVDSPKLDKEIADKFEETLSGLGLSKKSDTRSSLNKKISKDIEEKLENTLSGLGLEKKTIKKVMKNSESEELGNYDILGLIARGGMAEIYKAKKKGAKGFEKIIAIKKILSGYGEDDKYIEMFVDEAKIAAELSHPNIVQIYDFGKKDNYYFIAMEYVHGKDLRLILRKLSEQGRTMPEPMALYLIIKVLEALGYAHSAKTSTGKELDIVHRDISPPNILVSYNGDVKLTDFGVSKASTKMHQTVSGALKGKLLYMSPEQAKGELNIDARSDLYSVGIILFELLTGKKLFLADSELGVLKKVQDGIVSSPNDLNPSISDKLDQLVLLSLNRDRDKRYSNASEMIKDLENYYREHYENFPNHQHIASFLYNLFRDEIEEKNIVERPKTPPRIEPRIITPSPVKNSPTENHSTPAKDQPEDDYDLNQPILLETDPKEDNPDIVNSFTNKANSEESVEPLLEIKLDNSGPEEEPLQQIEEEDVPVEKELSPFDITEPNETQNSSPFKRILYIAASTIILIAILSYYFTKQPEVPNLPIPNGDTTFEDKISENPSISTNLKQKVSEPAEDDKDPNSIPVDTQELNSTDLTKNRAPGGSEALMKDQKSEPVKSKKGTSKKGKKRKIQNGKKEKSSDNSVKLPEKTSKQKPPNIKIEESIIPTKKRQQTVKNSTPERSPKKETEDMKITEGMVVDYPDIQPVTKKMKELKVPRSIKRKLPASETVIASYLINHEGNVETIKLSQKSSSSRLNSLIYSTIAEWKFEPAKKENIKVKFWRTKIFKIKK